MVVDEDDLTLAEHVCLCLVVGGVGHGWAIGSMLTGDGELGRIWRLSRPLTYRAIDELVARDLVARAGTQVGRGRARTVLRATARGRRVAAAWLDRPVAHLRDVRTGLLVKLTLRERAGLGTTPLLLAQQAAFSEVIAALTTADDGRSDVDLVGRWRAEHARAVRRFLDGALHPARTSVAPTPSPELRLSARNQLSATVESVRRGEVMATVKVVLPDGQRLTAAITTDATDELDLEEGDQVVVVVKSTEVMVAKAM